MTSEVEHLLMVLSAIHVSSWVKCLFSSLSIFKLFSNFFVTEFSEFLDLSSLSARCFAKISSSLWLIFAVSTDSFEEQKFLILKKFTLLISTFLYIYNR